MTALIIHWIRRQTPAFALVIFTSRCSSFGLQRVPGPHPDLPPRTLPEPRQPTWPVTASSQPRTLGNHRHARSVCTRHETSRRRSRRTRAPRSCSGSGWRIAELVATMRRQWKVQAHEQERITTARLVAAISPPPRGQQRARYPAIIRSEATRDGCRRLGITGDARLDGSCPSASLLHKRGRSPNLRGSRVRE